MDLINLMEQVSRGLFHSTGPYFVQDPCQGFLSLALDFCAILGFSSVPNYVKYSIA